MPTQQPTLGDCIESLRLHIRSLQRTGLRFDMINRCPAPADQASRPARLAALREKSTDCTGCRLCRERTSVVFGEGNADARLMFVGGAPDNASDAQGRPFAGPSGELLTRIIGAINLRRDQVYVTTAVKCLAPQGDPGKESVEACLPFLHRQIEIIQPEIICTLGPVAARALQEPGSPDAPLRGNMYRMGTIPVMPTHHPELLLRRPELKNETWIDVQVIQRELGSHTQRKQ